MGLHALRDPQVAAQIAGHREREEGQRGPLQRREVGGKPHASFNSGMSVGREGRDSGYPRGSLQHTKSHCRGP